MCPERLVLDNILNLGVMLYFCFSLQTSNADPNMVPINESIISLLLKLHSQLSGCLDSFSLEDDNTDLIPEQTSPMDTSSAAPSPIGVRQESCDISPSGGREEDESSSAISPRVAAAAEFDLSDKRSQSSIESISTGDLLNENRIGKVYLHL